MKGDIGVSDINLKKLLNHSFDVDSYDLRGVLKTSAVSWKYLPEDIMLIILDMLNGKDLANLVKVCSRWRLIADNDALWEKKFKNDFHIKSSMMLRPGAVSWKKEYERLIDNVPCVELDKIEEHTDEVLHVSFSHNGMMFCTCSKDAFVKVYNADWPFNTIFNAHHGGRDSLLNWKYTQFSQFSPSDTQLLVSGRSDVSELGGEIVIYNIFAGIFSIQARIRICPYDVMGTWINESHVLSATAHRRMHTMQCLTEIILNKSAQDIENIHQSTVTRAFLFRSGNLATVSYLVVADLARALKTEIIPFLQNDLSPVFDQIHYNHLKSIYDKQLRQAETQKHTSQICPECYMKNLSQRKAKRLKTCSSVLRKKTTCFSFCSKSSRSSNYTDEPGTNSFLKSCGVSASDTLSIAESERQQLSLIRVNDQAGSELYFCILCGKPILFKDDDAILDDYDSRSSSASTGTDDEWCHFSIPKTYKILLCFTGISPRISHQIGVKIIERDECSEVADGHISDKFSSESNRPKIVDWDKKLELRGQGIGMALSPCNRFLYVNVRRWTGNWQPNHDLNLNDETPPLSKHVQVVVYDLITMKEVSSFSGHNSYKDVFYIHLTSNDLYLASGSGDSCGYVWDCNYEVKVAMLPHESVVNCVAVNPRDPSMAVSVSDDSSIKIWRSKAFSRMLKGARPKARIKSRLHHSHRI